MRGRSTRRTQNQKRKCIQLQTHQHLGKRDGKFDSKRLGECDSNFLGIRNGDCAVDGAGDGAGDMEQRMPPLVRRQIAKANATANASPVKIHFTLNVSEALGNVCDDFVDADRPHMIRVILSVYYFSKK